MSRRVVEKVVILLDILSVVSLRVGEPKQPFLQKRVRSIPEGERKAEDVLPIRDSKEPVFAPSIRAIERHVMGKRVPGIARSGVVFPHRTPLPLCEIWPPAMPGLNLL